MPNIPYDSDDVRGESPKDVDYSESLDLWDSHSYQDRSSSDNAKFDRQSPDREPSSILELTNAFFQLCNPLGESSMEREQYINLATLAYEALLDFSTKFHLQVGTSVTGSRACKHLFGAETSSQGQTGKAFGLNLETSRAYGLAFQATVAEDNFFVPTALLNPFDREKPVWGGVAMDPVEVFSACDLGDAAGLIAQFNLSEGTLTTDIYPIATGKLLDEVFDHVDHVAKGVKEDRTRSTLNCAFELRPSIIVASALGEILTSLDCPNEILMGISDLNLTRDSGVDSAYACHSLSIEAVVVTSSFESSSLVSDFDHQWRIFEFDIGYPAPNILTLERR